MQKEEKKLPISKWIYYPALGIFLLGILNMFSGSMKWGSSPFDNIAIVITWICLGIVITRDVLEWKNKS